MKFEADRYRYPLEADRLEGAVWWVNDPETHPGEPCFQMSIMPSDDIVKLHAREETSRKKLTAHPTYMALLCNELWIWPTPHKNLAARVRYSTFHEV